MTIDLLFRRYLRIMLMARIDLYSHFFMVTQVHPHFKAVIRRACEELIQVNYVKIRGRVQRQATKVFAASNKDKSEFRFHINYYKRFCEIMHACYMDTNIEVYQHELYEPSKTKQVLKTPEYMKARDYQLDTIDYIRSPGGSKLVTLATGAGKCAPLNTDIRIPNGWKKMDDIVEGDILSMPNGDEGKVLNVFDFDDKPFYRITFADGRTAECSDDHIWWVYSAHNHYCMKANEWTAIDTKQLYELCEYHRQRQLSRGIPEDRIHYRLHIPLVDPTHSSDKEICLPIDPYILGVILGDGTIGNYGSVIITKSDLAMIDELNKIVNKDNIHLVSRKVSDDKCPQWEFRDKDSNELYHKLHQDIVAFGLNGKRSWDKFIPDSYLEGSFDQRLALIQGLMDTDGSCGKSMERRGCAIEYSTTSKRLAEQVLYLLRSVGCIAKLRKRQTYYTYNGQRLPDRESYRINVRAQIPSLLFRSITKKQYCKDENQYNIKGLKLRITKVEKLDKQGKARCLAIDHPDHAYITNDYVVTHNTFTSLKYFEGNNTRLIIIVLARYLEKWKQDVIENFGKDVNLFVPSSGKELVRLFMTAKDEYEREVTLKKSQLPDITLISSNSFQRYLTTWEQADEYEKEALVCPHDIFRYMGVGLKILDEAHQHFHLNFKMDLYQHIPKAVYLTATLESNDAFMQRMYQLMWPMEMRDKVLEYNKYDFVYAYLYQHENPKRIRCISAQGYSHIAYEQSIFKHTPSRRQYLDMIGDVVENYFIPEYKPGRKMLIFCSLIETCQIVAEYLAKRFKDQHWKISKFTSGDPKEVIDTNDVTVSTLGKSGTALDIPGLIQVLMTVALSEPKANLQAKGRNRNLKSKPGFEDVTPKFIYFVGQDIDKHRQYHHEKIDLFRPRTLMIREIQSPYKIGEPMDEYLRHQGKTNNSF